MKPFLIFTLLISSTLAFAQVAPAFKDIVKDLPNVRDVTLSINGDEVYMSSQSPMGELSAIIRVQAKNKTWQPPRVASFSGRYHDIEPFLALDGLTLYFASNRPLDQKSSEVKDYDIWYVERGSRSEYWSTPKNIGAPINTNGNEFYPSVTNNGNIYFTADGIGTKGLDDIFVSIYSEGEYASPISLDTTINTKGYEFNAYVAPDESYLIFTGYNRQDGIGSGDLYLSKKNADGRWSAAENIILANSDKMDYCPFVDAAQGIMYFTSKRSGILFNAKTELQSLTELKEIYNLYDNGQSRLYQASISSMIE